MQDTPWSYVLRFVTSKGSVYLKHTPARLALEAPITQILHDQFHAPVPVVIAHSAELNCFLMKDAGQSLRVILKKKFNALLLCKAIDQFTAMQCAVADHIAVFFDQGVPDWRLDKLPHLYKQLLLQKELLIAEGLSEAEISELETLWPRLCRLCETLSAYAMKQTLVQCDFHDNNILIDESLQALTFIDLGEVVIAHPFFSLIGCLRQAKFHHGLADQDDTYLQLRGACLKNFMITASKARLLDAFAMAEILWHVYEALAQYRLMLACDKERFKSFQKHGKLSSRLKEWMVEARKANVSCHCDSEQEYKNCCEPYLLGKAPAPTPEALMRSRYTAFVKRKFAYLSKTLSGPAAKEFDISAARRDAPRTKWLKLEVIRADEMGNQGLVEFNAHFRFQGKVAMMHEVSRFEKNDGEWFYVGRDLHKQN